MLARLGARQQQVRDVHARDQQQEGDGAEQNLERRQHTAHGLVAQSVSHDRVLARIEMVGSLRTGVALHEQVELRLRLLECPRRLQTPHEEHAVIVDGFRVVDP